MPTKIVGAVYKVESKYVDTDSLTKYRDALPASEPHCKIVKAKVVSLVRGTRTYVCKLVGSDVTVHLSSKSLAEQDSTRPHARQARYEESEIDADGSVENAESDAEDEDVLDNDADRARVDSLHDLTAQDWKRVAAFTDVMHERYPHFDIDQKC
jgi:hypothetical protein